MRRVRHALTSERQRRHVLMVYDERDKLICWCGPYSREDALSDLRKWVGAGWSGPRYFISEVA